MKLNAQKIIESSDLCKVQWITKNPGRQWTASINPIVKDPRDWYGNVYVSFKTGLHEIETTLRLIFNNKNKSASVWNQIPRDMFNIILQKLAMVKCNYNGK